MVGACDGAAVTGDSEVGAAVGATDVGAAEGAAEGASVGTLVPGPAVT